MIRRLRPSVPRCCLPVCPVKAIRLASLFHLGPGRRKGHFVATDRKHLSWKMAGLDAGTVRDVLTSRALPTSDSAQIRSRINEAADWWEMRDAMRSCSQEDKELKYQEFWREIRCSAASPMSRCKPCFSEWSRGLVINHAAFLIYLEDLQSARLI